MKAEIKFCNKFLHFGLSLDPSPRPPPPAFTAAADPPPNADPINGPIVLKPTTED